MNITSVLVGSPYFRTRMFAPLLLITSFLGLGWLYAINMLENTVSQQTGLFVFLAIPILITIGAVGVFTYKGEGILFGWLIGATFIFWPIVLFFYDGLRKEISMGRDAGIVAYGELLLGGALWSLIFTLSVGILGLILGGAIRFFTIWRA